MLFLAQPGVLARPVILVGLKPELLLSGSQRMLLSDLTEEQKLRDAISDPSRSSFELTSNIKLTQSLPPFGLLHSAIRKFHVYSKRGFTINGAKHFRGFWTFRPTVGSAPRPRIELLIDNVNLINFRANAPTGVEPGEAGSDYFLLGAAIRVAGIVKISESLIAGNSAQLDGGALYVTDGALQLKKCNIVSNTSRRQGGAIAHLPNGQGALAVEDCLFTGNRAVPKAPTANLARGGAVFVEELFGPGNVLSVKFCRTTFKGNSAFNGGAFFTFFPAKGLEKPLIFDSCVFESNVAKGKAEPSGGAIFANYVDEIQFIQPKFKNNVAKGVRNDLYVYWNVPGFATLRGTAGAGAMTSSNQPGRFIVV
eukprot:TRINITY_DN734_c2_g7_i1.p1 TRINITY_DN734_c2_g7~~TRINITY_DN734_c2_g7_i1.p1  ORF type:complete len:366 (-),score=49.03 TRINITY_DN734_c2_g7_i1:280-1377(-)